MKFRQAKRHAPALQGEDIVYPSRKREDKCAHPRKTKAGEALTNDDVSGSSAITNLADNVIAVEKPNLRITKNRDFGICDFIECSYNPANRRIFQTAAGDRLVYGWDHSGLEEPRQKACDLPEFQIQRGEPQTGLGM